MSGALSYTLNHLKNINNYFEIGIKRKLLHSVSGRTNFKIQRQLQILNLSMKYHE